MRHTHYYPSGPPWWATVAVLGLVAMAWKWLLILVFVLCFLYALGKLNMAYEERKQAKAFELENYRLHADHENEMYQRYGDIYGDFPPASQVYPPAGPTGTVPLPRPVNPDIYGGW